MTDLSDLIARVEGLEGPNFAAECAIFEALEMPREWFGQPVVSHFMDGAGYGFNTADGYRHHDCIKPPTYTASLDAALALVERCLPGWELEIASEHKAEGPVWRVGLGDQMLGFDGEAPTPAMALILALLHALAAKEPS